MQAEPLRAIHVFTLGCCALIAQSVFVRELMPLFTGSEFVVGAVLAGWLFWVGAGALLGGRGVAAVEERGFGRFAALAVALALLLPATIVSIRAGRGLLARPPGAFPPLGAALAFALVATAPFGLAYGALYNVASALWGSREGGLRRGISRVYIWEAAGSFTGAILFSFVLIAAFSQLQSALIAGLLLALSVVPSRGARAKRIGGAAAVFAAAFVLSALSPSIDRASIASVYRGYRIEKFYESPYGEVVVAREREVRTVFCAGGRLFSYPEPERTQETIDIPLLMCPEPRSVLLIGGSLGGGWEEARKHPSVEAIDCIELDGSLFWIGIADSASAAAARGAPGRGPCRVRFIAADGRLFLSRGRHRYDCIILSSPPPVNLQWNRFYTREFFEIARRSLNPGGVFACTHPSSENFIRRDQAEVLETIDRTLAAAFPRVIVLPGSTAHFLASDRSLDPGSMLPRLAARGLHAPFVGEGYLPFRLTPERVDELRASLAAARTRGINTDARPILPLRELLLEAGKAGSALTGLFRAVAGVPAGAAAGVLGGAVLLLFGAAPRRARARLAVWSIGLASLLFQLLVLLLYQSFSGVLYRGIVLLAALFMAGAALGAFLAARRETPAAASLRGVHARFMLLAAVLGAWTAVPRALELPYGAGSALFMLLSLGGGFLTGAYYPVVVRTAFVEGGAQAPAELYAWDLFGACAGGIGGGLLFFPVLGLAGTAFFIAFVNLAALVFLAGKW